MINNDIDGSHNNHQTSIIYTEKARATGLEVISRATYNNIFIKSS